MPPFRFTPLVLIVSLTALSHLAHGGDLLPDREASLEQRFKLLPYGDVNTHNIVFFPKANVNQRIHIYFGSRSEAFTLHGTRELILYERYINDLGELDHRPTARTIIPDAIESPLVVIAPNHRYNSESPESLPYTLYVINDSKQAIPPNHLGVYLGLKAPLTLKVGEEEYDLVEGLSHPISVKKTIYKDNPSIDIVLHHKDLGFDVLSTRQRFLPDRRNLIIVLPPKNEGGFEYVVFRVDDFEA